LFFQFSNLVVECPLPQLTASLRVDNPNSTYFYGYVITLSCKEGHILQAGNTSVCQATSEWSEPFPVCNSKYYLFVIKHHICKFS